MSITYVQVDDCGDGEIYVKAFNKDTNEVEDHQQILYTAETRDEKRKQACFIASGLATKYDCAWDCNW